MVAPSVPRLGFEPQVCLARPILVYALDLTQAMKRDKFARAVMTARNT